MPEIICYTPYLSEGSEQYISFMELLLDDNWSNGEIVCPEEVYHEVGDINYKLTAKQQYEFLLRAVQKYPLKAIGQSSVTETACDFIDIWEHFRTDCYIVGKYQQVLLNSGYFNPVIETLLGTVSSLPNPKQATDWMEQMISHAPAYYEIDDDTCPILIYRGDDTCYNQLNAFADELAKALTACHQIVEIHDLALDGHHSLTNYIGRHFKAIIGIQTYAFSIMMQDKITNLHDLIIGPKFNMILDHPALLKEHLTVGPENYYLLLHDRNYIKYAGTYYPNLKDCFHFTPAGTPYNPDTNTGKKYTLSFIGTYYNYRHILQNIKSMHPKLRSLALDLLQEMKKNPNQPTEIAIRNVLNVNQLHLSDEQFLELTYELRYVSFSIMYYYREKIVRTLLDAGIEINVFGDSWNRAPFSTHPCLLRHPQADARESLFIMQQSLISLNIMAWHKDGFTERIANAMLNHSLVISDYSKLLNELFVHQQDIILFDLQNIQSLPSLIHRLLTSPEQIDTITEHAYLKAFENHTWIQRAKQLLSILNTKF